MGDQDDHEVLDTETVFDGRVMAVRRDNVRMSDGSSAWREVIEHSGAVAVLALDDAGQVVLVNQYRHPVRTRLDELPAGLLDVDGEPPLAAAKRELAEEAGLTAGRWDVLLDLHSSPGVSNEAIRVYLARDLHAAADDDFHAEHEEAAMTVAREALAGAVRRALAGTITNAVAVAGLLAAAHGRATDWCDLRPGDAPWPAGPQNR